MTKKEKTQETPKLKRQKRKERDRSDDWCAS